MDNFSTGEPVRPRYKVETSFQPTGPVTRRALFAGAAAASLLIATPTLAFRCRPPRILFVCQFGSVKSPIAREHLRAAAAERNIAVEVASRGITPEEHLSDALAHRLADDRIDTKKDGLHRLTPADLARADTVVAFDRLPEGFRHADLRDWSSVTSMNSNYSVARADVLARIDRLLAELKARGCK